MWFLWVEIGINLMCTRARLVDTRANLPLRSTARTPVYSVSLNRKRPCEIILFLHCSLSSGQLRTFCQLKLEHIEIGCEFGRPAIQAVMSPRQRPQVICRRSYVPSSGQQRTLYNARQFADISTIGQLSWPSWRWSLTTGAHSPAAQSDSADK